MGRDSGGDYSLVETFAIIVVLADIPLIALAVVAGPLYAIALAVVILLAGVGGWYLSRRLDAADEPDHAARAELDDPVTELQQRYAAGELSKEEFEAKLDRLIESDERAEAAGVDTEELSLERSE